MTTATTNVQSHNLHVLPFIAPIAQGLTFTTVTLLLVLASVLFGVFLAINTFGIAGLAMTALALVPVMFVILFVITRG